MIGGEFGIMSSVAADNLLRRHGKVAGKTIVFLLRALFLKVGGLSEMLASLTKALVLPFSGVAAFYCFFLLSIMMGVLSSESLVGIWTMGVDGSASLRGRVCCRFSVLNWGVSATRC